MVGARRVDYYSWFSRWFRVGSVSPASIAHLTPSRPPIPPRFLHPYDVEKIKIVILISKERLCVLQRAKSWRRKCRIQDTWDSRIAESRGINLSLELHVRAFQVTLISVYVNSIRYLRVDRLSTYRRRNTPRPSGPVISRRLLRDVIAHVRKKVSRPLRKLFPPNAGAYAGNLSFPPPEFTNSFD